MTNQSNHPEQYLDPELEALLEILRHTPARDPRAIAQGRAHFLAQAREMLQSESVKVQPSQGFLLFRKLKEIFTMTTLKHRFAYTALMITLVLTLTIFGGIGATAYASQSALPGDALYPLKTSLEHTRLTLARDASPKVQLHLRYAERRLDEIAALLAEGRFAEIETATREFETQVQQAILALQIVAENDPQHAAELTTQISSALSRYAQTLSGLLVSVPSSVKPEVERALMVSNQATQGEIEFTGKVESISPAAWVVDGRIIQIAPGTEIKGVINLGDLVKVHALLTEDGSLVAREIELAPADEAEFNQNENANQNENENDNQNENLNENENENENIDRHGMEIRFTGIVEAISNTSWTISGRVLQVTPQTDMRGLIRIGDRVEVRAVQAPDGSLIALRLELEEEDHTNTNDNNLNANRNTNTNTNQNANANFNENENSNENHNSNDNGNTNQNANNNQTENENDNKNSNSNGNTNENDNGNSNSNENDNGNENGDD